MLEFNNLFKERLRLHSPILASLEKLRLRRNKTGGRPKMYYHCSSDTMETDFISYMTLYRYNVMYEIKSVSIVSEEQ